VEWYASVALGGAGGFIGEFLRWDKYRGKRRKPKAFSTGSYWVSGAIWVALGAFVSWVSLSEAQGVSKWTPVQLGLTAPLILRRLSELVPQGPPGTVD